MRGKTCVITGATSGIGFETAVALAAMGARIIGVGRNPKRCAAAADAVRARAPGAAVSYEVAELSSQAELWELAARIGGRVGWVDALINNAGTFTFARKESPEGIEMQLAVNWLSGFMLTGLLLPLLRAAPQARVVTISSGSHYAGRIHWKDPGLRRGYNGLTAYDQSKLATVLFTRELSRRLGEGSRLCAYAVDPGLVKTEIAYKANGRLVGLVWKLRTSGGISPEQAAESVAWCASAPEASGKTGLYWKEHRPLAPSRRALDDGDSQRLWEMGEKLCGVRYP